MRNGFRNDKPDVRTADTPLLSAVALERGAVAVVKVIGSDRAMVPEVDTAAAGTVTVIKP